MIAVLCALPTAACAGTDAAGAGAQAPRSAAQAVPGVGAEPEPGGSDLPGRAPSGAVPPPGFELVDVRVDAVPAGRLLAGEFELLSVDEDGRRLVLRYHAEPGCGTFVGVEVVERADEVLLSPLAQLPEPSGQPQMCPGMRTDGFGYVRLSEPLGTRSVDRSRPAQF